VLIGIDASRAAIEQRTGTEAYSLHLIRELVEMGTQHHFRLYFNASPAAGLFPDAAHCEQRVMPFPRLWTHLRLSVEMLLHPPDVLFVPSHVLPLVHPQRSVVTVHDLGHRYYPDTHTTAQRRYLEWSARYHVRKAAHLLADSQATKDDLVHLYGADPATVTVAHLGVDPTLHPIQDTVRMARVKHKCGIHGPYLLYVGTLQPRKNLVRLIDAFAQVLRVCKVQDLQLVLAGKRGWLYDDILARAKQLGLGDRVILPGFVPDADLASLYSGAALFVMPSLYEGFCMPVLEAMVCGTPVACSNAASLSEVAGDAALFFDPQDVDRMAGVLARALDDQVTREALVARGSAWAGQFTWQRCSRRVLSVLESVVSDGDTRLESAESPPTTEA
jgi:glycosyltransferase involved in cell wall biosynthesis